MMACFLDGPFVVCCILCPLLSGLGNTASWISRIFLFGRAGNTSLILRMLAAAQVAQAQDIGEFEELLPLVERVSWCFFELSICSLEGQDGIGGGVFLIVAVLGQALFSAVLLRICMFPKWVEMLSQMVVFLDECSWSQPDSKIVDMNSQADSPNSSSCGMLLPLCPSRLCCLRKHAMHCSEQAMLWTSLCKNSFMLNSEVAVKLPSHRLGSAGTFALQGMTVGREGFRDVLKLSAGKGSLGASLWGALSQTSFGHISTNSLTISTVSRPA